METSIEIEKSINLPIHQKQLKWEPIQAKVFAPIHQNMEQIMMFFKERNMYKVAILYFKKNTSRRKAVPVKKQPRHVPVADT